MAVDLAHLSTVITGLKPHEQELTRMLAVLKTLKEDLAKLEPLVEQSKHLADEIKIVDDHMKQLTAYETHLTQAVEGLRQLGA
jgi:prefoldin subunit 5